MYFKYAFIYLTEVQSFFEIISPLGGSLEARRFHDHIMPTLYCTETSLSHLISSSSDSNLLSKTKAEKANLLKPRAYK